MKVLISGGYELIGSTLAARFIKEGHDVTVVDNIADSEQWEAVREKYKLYNLSGSSPECEKIFGPAGLKS